MGGEAMTAAIEHEQLSTDVHPIDMVETLAEEAEWEFDRIGENQIAMAVEGIWHVYSLNLDWSNRDDTLRLICSFELTPPTERAAEMLELLNLINDKLWCGAFVLWRDHEMMAFRHGLTLAGGAMATPEQIEAMILSAIGCVERFYPAFQLVGWSDHSPAQAFAVAIEDAWGTA